MILINLIPTPSHAHTQAEVALLIKTQEVTVEVVQDISLKHVLEEVLLLTVVQGISLKHVLEEVLLLAVVHGINLKYELEVGRLLAVVQDINLKCELEVVLLLYKDGRDRLHSPTHDVLLVGEEVQTHIQ